jgi:hypothetical protein
MDQLVDEFKVKMEARVAILLKDIEDATTILEGYREELRPLLPMLKAVNSPLYAKVKAVAGGTTRTRQAPDTVAAHPTVPIQNTPVVVSAPEKSPAWRWSQYKLAPRHMRFLNKFGDKEGFIRSEVEVWYRAEVNPGIQDTSLRTGVNEITRCLIEKKIVTWDGPDKWKFVR